MSKLKNNKGITLVALIITVIVLLILAMVSIRLVINNGVVERGQTAVNAYQYEEVKEKIITAFREYQMGKMENSNYSFEEALENAGVNAKSVTLENETEYKVVVDTNSGEKTFIVTLDGHISEENIATTPQEQNTQKVFYFARPNYWVGNTVYCYLWGKNGNNEEVKNAQFPGVAMEKVSGDNNLYSYIFPEEDTNYDYYNNVIFTTESETDVPTTTVKVRTNATIDISFSVANLNKVFTPTAYSDPNNQYNTRIFVYPFMYPAGTSTVKAYAWNNSSNKAAWPGEEMQPCGQDKYYYIIDRNTYSNIIFNKGQDSTDKNKRAQTNDLTIPSEQDLTFIGYSNKTDGLWGHFLCDGVWQNR